MFDLRPWPIILLSYAFLFNFPQLFCLILRELDVVNYGAVNVHVRSLFLGVEIEANVLQSDHKIS